MVGRRFVMKSQFILGQAQSMPQLSLFDSRDVVFIDDATGRIAYTPHFVAADLARAWFDELREAVVWKAERRRMYDRDVDVPRLTAHYRLSRKEEAAPPPAILQAAAHVAQQTGVDFNSVGLNRYRDGHDSVAPHNDHLNEIVRGSPIALLSLGATRRMTIRAKELPRRVLHIPLEEGSLLWMSYDTQLHYTHGIPKTTDAVGERISLAFRVKPSNEDDDGGGGSFYQ
jgi:alkylated DNA repair dioxygenase AlkB